MVGVQYVQERSVMEGLCAKAVVGDETQARLRRLFVQRLRLPLQDSLHVTVMHHEGAWPMGMTMGRLDALVPPRVEMLLTDVEVWGAADRARARGLPEEAYQQGDLLVAVGTSPTAWDANRRLADMGFRHSFLEFRPHVTLARGRPGAFPPGLLSTVKGTALRGGLHVDFTKWVFDPFVGSAL